tara:strand:+ start:428 stop:748 length:321 start_codon:yes stop_codon:yes gene_type:complete
MGKKRRLMANPRRFGKKLASHPIIRAMSEVHIKKEKISENPVEISIPQIIEETIVAPPPVIEKKTVEEVEAKTVVKKTPAKKVVAETVTKKRSSQRRTTRKATKKV